jgi:hypothetical protein
MDGTESLKENPEILEGAARF